MAANQEPTMASEETASTSTVKLFTREEVAKNGTCEKVDESSKLWLIIHGSVYDVTKFVNEHPGGEEILIENSGKDVTEAFEDIGHSTDARNMMAPYKIGELTEEERNKVDEKEKESPYSNTDGNSWRSWLIPFALGVLATLVFRYFISTH